MWIHVELLHNMDMDMDNAELKDLRELKAIKELYGWTDETHS